MPLTRDEFIELALEQIDAVDRVARSLARDDAEADDLVQETYLKALRAYDGFDLRAFGIRPWLLRILHNQHVNRVKRGRREPVATPAEQLDGLASRPEASAAFAPADLQEFDDADLDRALAALPPDLRTILILWAVDELSYKELADVLGIPIGTVMSRLHRARNRLSALLSDHPAAARRTERPPRPEG